MALRKDADAERPVSRAMEYLDGMRAKIEKERAKGINPHDIFSRGPYRKHDYTQVKIVAVKEDKTEGDSSMVTGSAYRPVICLRDPKTQEWKEVWRFHQSYNVESVALDALGKIFTNIATVHSLTEKPEYNHWIERKAKASDRQRRRLEKQAQSMAASRGYKA